jgi:thiamine kinase-like enzyme
MAREDRQEDARGHRRYCKLHHGVPILRAEDADFREAYDAVIKPLDYETKLKAMDHWPVTSLMNKAQMSKFLEDIREDYRKRGVQLQFPEAA